MAVCKKCGHPLKFVRRQFGRALKWCPVNPDGSDHWDLCRGIVRTPSWVKKVMALPENRPQTTFPTDTAAFLWIGAQPPWDESLGEFRNFTEQEKVERLVCLPLRR